MSTDPQDPVVTSDTTDEERLIIEAAAAMHSLGQLICHRMTAAGFWQRRHAIIKALDDSGLFTEGEGQRLVAMEGVALIMSELGEGVEGIRKGEPDGHLPQFDSTSVELADAIIRILDLGAGLQLHVAQALVAKMAYNASRPKMHGKKS